MEQPRSWFSRSLMIIVMVIFVDQLSKVIVLKTMYRGQSIPVFGEWLRLTFTENPGMAFGIEFGPPAMITIFSLIATVLIVLYLFKVGGMFTPYRISLSMVLGGAFGNIIDRVFYGKILYGEPYFLGKVVDFIHFDIWRGIVPEGMPFLGGKYLALFPIWNVADMAIVLGVAGILFFQRRFHDLLEKQNVDLALDPKDRVVHSDSSSVEESDARLPAESPGESGGEGDDPGQEKSV